MTELDEIQIDPNPEQAPPGEEPFRYTWPLIAAAIVIVLIVVGTLVMRGRMKSEPAEVPEEAQAAATTEEKAPAPVEVEPIVLPPLAESDALIRELVGALTSHPKLMSMLASDQLIRGFSAAIDNIARGESPRSHLRGVGPSGRFQARESAGGAYLDPSGYVRYDTIADVVGSLDTEGTLETYRQLKPLIQEAYRDLGYPQADFDQILRRAIRHLLATPVVTAEPELIPGVRSYEFADPSLEGLSDAQKHLLRMGPQNVGKIQTKLRELDKGLN